MHPGREHEDELTVFKSLGIAVEDLASAELVVQRARAGVGPRSTSIPLAEIERAREIITGLGIRTPLLRLAWTCLEEIWLKLENLQPIGSFKIRGAANAMAAIPTSQLARGWSRRAREHGPGRRLVAREPRRTWYDVVLRQRLRGPSSQRSSASAARIIRRRASAWWQTFQGPGVTRESTGGTSSPVRRPRVMAGNGTIGLELLEDLDASTPSSSPGAEAA